MKTLAVECLILLLLAVASGVATKRWHPYAPVAPTMPPGVGQGRVTVAEALRWSRDGLVVWIDARKRDAFDAGHAPGAYLINEFAWDDLMWESGPELMQMTDKRFVVYCGNHDCRASERIADRLRARRFPEVYVLEGGWPALEKELAEP